MREARSMADGSRRKVPWVRGIGNSDIDDGIAVGGEPPGACPPWGESIAGGKQALQGELLPGGKESDP